MAVNLKKKKLVSIVIKDDEIKIAELTRNGKNIRVQRAVTVTTPIDAVIDGELFDLAALAATLNSAFSLNKIFCKDAVFSLVSTKIATKEVVIPYVKENKIADIVSMNASDYFPVNVEQYQIKYSVLEKTTIDNEEKYKIQVVAAPNELIEKYYELAEMIGINIETMDYSGNSSYQVLKMNVPSYNIVVINVENNNTVVSIFENNILKLQRVIPYGLSLLVNAIKEEQNIESDEKARYILREEGRFLHDHFDGDSMTESLRYLVSSVSRVTDYYTTRNGNKVFENAYLVGEATSIDGFTTLLTNELKFDLRIENIENLQNVTIESNASVQPEYITSYISNIGALISPVGFSKKYDEKEKSSNNTKKYLIGALPVVLVISAALVLLPFLDYTNQKRNVEKVKKDIEELSDINEVVDEYYTAMDKAYDMRGFDALTKNNNDALYNFILQLESKIPSDVSFNSMTVSSGQVNLSGKASSKSSVAKLIQQLQSINGVAGVVVSNETESKDNSGVITASFSLTCTFDNAVINPAEEVSEQAVEVTNNENTEQAE